MIVNTWRTTMDLHMEESEEQQWPSFLVVIKLLEVLSHRATLANSSYSGEEDPTTMTRHSRYWRDDCSSDGTHANTWTHGSKFKRGGITSTYHVKKRVASLTPPPSKRVVAWQISLSNVILKEELSYHQYYRPKGALVPLREHDPTTLIQRELNVGSS